MSFKQRYTTVAFIYLQCNVGLCSHNCQIQVIHFFCTLYLNYVKNNLLEAYFMYNDDVYEVIDKILGNLHIVIFANCILFINGENI